MIFPLFICCRGPTEADRERMVMVRYRTIPYHMVWCEAVGGDDTPWTAAHHLLARRMNLLYNERRDSSLSAQIMGQYR